ncbi:hypothetical protein COU80_05310 [Candidatus Peregrinibacteria bacterium CG10_big_fil_rev_8_21_14_0_10_55_24]|nr:MAG: hypothetical protein COU80_05310 [Candidatus Peregrinibacteria bacterium CG10_big_fil_rev_8_21_14_0_10_55_24]
MVRSPWFWLLLGTAFSIAFLMQVPQLLHMSDLRYQGVLVHLNSDEYAYLARVEEALTGRPEQAAEAIIGDPSVPGAQSAFLERFYGTLFQWTGWRAATLLQVMDSVVPPLLFLAVWIFLFLSGFTRFQAFLGALLFVFLSLYNLNRPLYQRASTLLTLLSMSGLLLGLKGHRWTGIAGAILLGTLVGTYFWSWTYALVWCGLLFAWFLLRSLRGEASLRRLLILLCGFGAIALVAALPFLVELWRVAQHPLYDQAAQRSGMHPGRLPESWGYTGAFLLMFLGLSGAFLAKPQELKRFGIVFITLAASVIVIHQQLIHGVVFNYVSHSLFLLEISAIGVLLLSCSLRSRWLLFSLVGAVVYLAAIGYDGRHVFDQFRRDAGSYSEQHFASLLPVLDKLPRSTILSDPQTEMFLAGSTHHDVVTSLYLKNVLLSNEELAQRLCLALVPLPEEEWNIAQREYLIHPDASAAFGSSVRDQEVALVTSVCAQVQADVPDWVSRFGVAYILWDEERQPAWDPLRLRVPLTFMERGEGWSLWSIHDAGFQARTR